MSEQVQIQIEDATDEQLRYHAKVTLGLEIDGRSGRDSIVGKIVLAQTDRLITVPRDMAPDAPAVSAAPQPPTPKPRQAPQSSSFESKDRPAEAAPAPVPGDGATGRLDTDSRNDEMVAIVVQKQGGVAGKDGERPKYVAVNGVAILIPRGTPVVVPIRYVRALEVAIETITEQDPDTGELTSYDLPNTPFQVLPVIPPDAEWLKGRRGARDEVAA